MDRNTLLGHLPPYENREHIVSNDQDVQDIIDEVLESHKVFAKDYDNISEFFYSDNVKHICEQLFNFCKKNIRYSVESEEDQTTRSPAAILALGHGDCKHYAGFIGGVLDGLKRQGCPIDWKYRFASYNIFHRTPGHVFVIVKDAGKEFWIDPVLPFFNQRLEPVYIVDKILKLSGMPLTRISGMTKGEDDLPYLTYLPDHWALGNSNGVGAFNPVTFAINQDQLDYDGTHRYAGIFGDTLTLSNYKDNGGAYTWITDWNKLAADINNLIAAGPAPGHTVDPSLLKSIYDHSVRSWNFYYPDGVRPGFSADNILPATFARPVITPDGRLTLNKNGRISQFNNPEVHILTAWLQSLISELDNSPYIIGPDTVEAYTTKYGDMLNDAGANFFNEWRGQSFLTDIGKAFEDVVNFVKDGFLKIVGSIPRNAFLGLIGINAFNFAGNMWEKIEAGRWDEMANDWKGLGGNPDKLRNTIENGKDKPAILGEIEQLNIIGVEPATTSTATLLAAAAPIIAILLKYLDKSGKATEVATALKNSINSGLFPQLKVEMGSNFQFLDKTTGKPITWVIDPADNENLGGGNDAMPGTGPIEWVKKNPIAAFAIGFTLWEFLAPRKMRLINK